jgi:phage FluMu gp28-like protein
MIAVFVVPRIARKLRTEEQYRKCAVADFTAKMCIASVASYWQIFFFDGTLVPRRAEIRIPDPDLFS